MDLFKRIPIPSIPSIPFNPFSDDKQKQKQAEEEKQQQQQLSNGTVNEVARSPSSPNPVGAALSVSIPSSSSTPGAASPKPSVVTPPASYTNESAPAPVHRRTASGLRRALPTLINAAPSPKANSAAAGPIALTEAETELMHANPYTVPIASVMSSSRPNSNKSATAAAAATLAARNNHLKQQQNIAVPDPSSESASIPSSSSSSSSTSAPAYSPPLPPAPGSDAQKSYFASQVAATHTMASPPARRMLRERLTGEILSPSAKAANKMNFSFASSPEALGKSSSSVEEDKGSLKVNVDDEVGNSHTRNGSLDGASGNSVSMSKPPPPSRKAPLSPHRSHPESQAQLANQTASHTKKMSLSDLTSLLTSSSDKKESEERARAAAELERLEAEATRAQTPQLTPEEIATKLAAAREAEIARAEAAARELHQTEAKMVSEHVDAFSKKLREAADKKKQAKEVMQQAADARAIARVEAEAEKKRRLAGIKSGPASSEPQSSPSAAASESVSAASSPQSSGSPSLSPSSSAATSSSPVTPLPTSTSSFAAAARSHEDEEIARVLKEQQKPAPSHPYTLASPVKSRATAELTLDLEESEAAMSNLPTSFVVPSPLIVDEGSKVLTQAQFAALTPRKPPVEIKQVIKEVVKEVVKIKEVPKEVIREVPAKIDPIPNFHTQVLSDYASPLLKDARGQSLREWHGCACGCGVAMLSCNLLNQQAQLLSNLQKQYDTLQQYVSQLHAGLATQNIALDKVLPAGAAATRQTIVGALVTLEASNRNTVRDVFEGMREAVPREEAKAWLHTAQHPNSLIVNQPLKPTADQMTYALALHRQFIHTTYSNVYDGNVVKSMVVGDDDAPDSGLGIRLLNQLPMSFSNQSVTKTLFDWEEEKKIKLDLPDVIVCELGEIETRPRANALCYERREDVPGLLKPSPQIDIPANNEPPLTPSTLHLPSPNKGSIALLSRTQGRNSLVRDPSLGLDSRTQHRNSLSIGALAAGLSRDHSASTTGDGAPSSASDALSTLLRNPTGFQLLHQLCLDEHSEENIQLWAAVEAFNAELDWTKRVGMARDIIDKHIRRDSPHQINLPSQVTDDIVACLDSLDAETVMLGEGLTTAQNIALKLLHCDSYKRFMSPGNPHGAKWVKYQQENPQLFARKANTDKRGADGSLTPVGSPSPAASPTSVSVTTGTSAALNPSSTSTSSSVSSSAAVPGSNSNVNSGSGGSASRASSPVRERGPPAAMDNAVHAIPASRIISLVRQSRILIFDPSTRTLSMHRTKAGSTTEAEGSPEVSFGVPSSSSSGDVLMYVKLSRNDPTQVTLFYHDKNEKTAESRATKTPIGLKVRIEGNTTTTTATRSQERERFYQLVRSYGLMESEK